MNFQQLRSIREAVRRQFNLTEVANALYTSQPGVSRQIRELEDELGVEIFERYGKRLTGLTEPGREIVRIVERLLLEAENLRQAGEEFSGRQSGRLTVATTHTQARYALPKVVQAFRKSYPHVTLALQEASPSHIVELLLTGQADIGVATEAVANEPGLTSFEAYRWRHVLVVSPDHPLTKNPLPTLEDVAQYPLITYDAGFTGRRNIDAAFTGAGLYPEIVLTAMDADVIKTYVALDVVWASSPRWPTTAARTTTSSASGPITCSSPIPRAWQCAGAPTCAAMRTTSSACSRRTCRAMRWRRR
ncbi:hypothetical protein ACEQUB_01844 [Ralstonia syzygii]